MNSKILLINFTEKDRDKLKTLSPLVFDRGYMNDLSPINENEKNTRHHNINDEHQDSIDFFSPLPIYEYKIVFVNLHTISSLKKEFLNKTEKLTGQNMIDFIQYWWKHGKIIVAFLGDYSYTDLVHLGILYIKLELVANNDVSVRPSLHSDGIFQLTNQMKSNIKMPTNHYIDILDNKIIVSKEDKSIHYDTKPFLYTRLYGNHNDRNLGIIIESYESSPRVVIVPQFKLNTVFIEKFLFRLGELYPGYLSELSNSNWMNTNTYYPAEINDYDKKIRQTEDQAKATITEFEQQKEEAKNRYISLHGILTQTGDELKTSVLDVLSNIFELDVIDSDIENNALQGEDILIKHNGLEILVEVKGTVSQNPQQAYIGQIWKHVAQYQNSNTPKPKGALILNHDRKTNPRDRTLAYKGEDESTLKDIIFIDTRVLHKLALGIIDYDINPEDATKILLKDGRVDFNLEQYIEANDKNATADKK